VASVSNERDVDAALVEYVGLLASTIQEACSTLAFMIRKAPSAIRSHRETMARLRQDVARLQAGIASLDDFARKVP